MARQDGMTQSGDAAGYCAEEVRAHDPERYLISLFAADVDRPALHAAYAFNLELARVASIVSEPILGQIRLQWWREAIEEIYEGAPRHHEVVMALAEAVRTRSVPRQVFEAMISGRETEIEPEPPATMADLESYLQATAGEFVALSLHMVGVEEGSALLSAGREVGMAAGLVTVIRALRTEAGRRRPLLPRDLLARHGVSGQDIAAGRPTPGITAAVRELADKAQAHLDTARRAFGRPPREHMAPLLAGALVPSYRKALEKSGYDPFEANYERGSFGRHLRLYRSALLRRI